jgi:hypothetical protein
VAVFREEQKGAEGLKMAREKTKATFPFVMDLGAEHTAAYSVGVFSTYVIDQGGTVKAELPGTKMVRPAVEDVLGKVEDLVGAEQ